MKQGEGAHLTKPGWSKPHTHSIPTNLTLFGYKITLYRSNRESGGGLILFAEGSNRSRGGLSPLAPLTLTTEDNSKVVDEFSFIEGWDVSLATNRFLVLIRITILIQEFFLLNIYYGEMGKL